MSFDGSTLAAAPIREDVEYGGLRVVFAARLGTAEIRMQVDVGFGNAIVPAAIDQDYPTLLDAPAPRIRAYPHEAVVAEKLHATVKLGEINSRYKDFYDLYVLATQFPFDGEVLTGAIAATFERRQTLIESAVPAALAPRFYADDARARQWRAYLTKNALPGAPADWTAVGELLQAFLSPLWDALANGRDFSNTWPPRRTVDILNLGWQNSGMTSAPRTSREIDGKGRTIRELLAGRKYSIDYYQREYKWQQKQVAELIDDLAAKFLESHDPDNDRSDVADYGHYFLGSIIISDKEGQKYIIDGQQRLTTLTLLLIFLHHKLKDEEHKGQIADLIFSQKFGKRSFNLDIPERTACMEALYKLEEPAEADVLESVANIRARYADIEDLFPDELAGDALPYFVDWLVENVQLVEITAYSDEDAYTIFETMNDRGLSLTPADMLKGYLLANIGETEHRTRASTVWKERVQALTDIGKDEDADGIKSWLRSQYADSIRERKRGAAPQDFDLIGTEIHRWVRDNEERLGLVKSGDFARFIERDFAFYSHWYERLRRAGETLTPGLECVHFNAQHNFTLQYPVLLAPLRVDDNEADIRRKLRIVSAYLDILINRRIWNWRAIDYSTMQYAMFLVMRDIRGVGVVELVKLLRARLDAETETFATNDGFRLHGTNGRQIHRMLARMIDYIETRSGLASRYTEYAKRGRKDYEIEHIWADHPERHTDEFAHPSEFQEYRNRIGGLLLLPKSFNASYGDLPYAKKRKHYLEQNLLAQSLHEQTYEHNPGFVRFIKASGLPFRAHAEFKKADLDARQALYQKLAELIWSPERLAQEVAS